MKWSKYTVDCANVLPLSGNKTPVFCLIAVDIATVDREPHVAQQLLAFTEQNQYITYTFKKRRLEWLCGRLACKVAVAQLLGLVCLQDIVVANTEHGRPFIQGLAGHQVQVSISHSGRFAVALASVSRCGVDIQEITPSLKKVEGKFIYSGEIARLKPYTSSAAEQRGLLWASKEALRKQVEIAPLLGFLESRLASVAVAHDYCMAHHVPVEQKRTLPPNLPVVYATMYERYALALCFFESQTEISKDT